MKRCPTCQSAYTDDSLVFCLQDGARLLPASDSSSPPSVNATWILPEHPASRREPTPTKAAESRAAPTLQMGPTAQTAHEPPAPDTAREAQLAAPPQKTTSPLLMVGIAAIVILLLSLVGIGIALLLRPASTEEQRGGTSPGASSNADAKTNDNPPAQITASASSTRVPMKTFNYDAAQVLDGDLATAWIEGSNGPGIGAWLRCDFGREVKVKQVLLTPGYFKNTSIWKQNNRLSAATLHFSNGTSRRYTFPDLMQQQRLDTGGIRTRFVRLVIEEIYPGSVDSEDTAISEISFDWEQ